MARGNPRPHITWFKDGAEIFQHLYMHVSHIDCVWLHFYHIFTDCVFFFCRFTNGASAKIEWNRKLRLIRPHKWMPACMNAQPIICIRSIVEVSKRISQLHSIEEPFSIRKLFSLSWDSQQTKHQTNGWRLIWSANRKENKIFNNKTANITVFHCWRLPCNHANVRNSPAHSVHPRNCSTSNLVAIKPERWNC